MGQLVTLIAVVAFLHGSASQTLCKLGDSPTVLTSWNGTFSSPEGDALNTYPSNQDCEWRVRVSQGSRVRLTFVTFELEDGYFKDASPGGGNMSCNDVVKVYEDNGVLFSGCQSDALNRSFESSSNVIMVRFYSDENTEKSGFNATYEGICGNNITESSYLESPGYPDPPPEGVTCTWDMTSAGNQQILYLRRDENDTSHVLPPCGVSSLKWQTTRDVKGLRPKNDMELCRSDSRIVSMSDVRLTYRPTGANDSWVGRLYLDFNTTSGCKRYCDHGFDCTKGKTFDVGDYRCLCQPPYSGRNCEIYENPCDAAKNCSDVGSCVITDDGANFTCSCQPGYTGRTCEGELDPCVDLACPNGGVCQKRNATLALCDCPQGFEPPDCRPAPTTPTSTTRPTAPKPGLCDSSPCQHGGTCMGLGSVGYKCSCQHEYTGAVCSISTGEAHCPTEVDDVLGSGIKWEDTLVGSHDDKECPPGSSGQARRNCMPDERSPYGGLWRRPDLSACVSPVMVRLASESSTLTHEGVEGDTLYNVTRNLDNVTSVLLRTGSGGEGPRTPALFPGDLLMASDILVDIAAGVVNAKSVEEDPPALAQHFTSAIGNLLHLSTLDIWKNARVHLVHNKVTSILTSAQKFAENLVRRQQGIRVGFRGAASDASLTLLGSSVGNVDLSVTRCSEPNKSWSPFADSDLTGVTSANSSTIRLPPDILNIARGDGIARNVTFYTGRFKSVAPLLSLKEHRYSREEEENVTKLINSDILSAEVLELPKTAFSKLEHPVEITFRLTDPVKRTDLKKYCVFMNTSSTDPETRWLTDGCFVEYVTSTHVTCACYHLTNFAVLLDVYDNAAELDKTNNAALSYISYIGGSLSILACVVVIAVFEYFRLSSDRVRIHEQLAVSIAAVQILFLIGVGRTAADHSTPKWACKTVAILLHYSLVALFCWMLVEGIHIYLLLVKVFKRSSHLKKYCAIGWGIPFIVVGISVGVFYDKYGDNNVCWLNHDLLLVCFVPAVALVVIINTVILILVLRVMLKSLHSTTKANTEHQSSVRTSLKASAVLLPLLGLTWTLGFLAVDTGDTKIMVYLFTYLFTICNSFQGVLFFVFHCLLNVDVHNAYERRYRQRKRALSSLETNTRKSSDVSTYLPDSTHQGKNSTKSNLSDMSIMHRKPSLFHNRFLLFDNHQSTRGVDPTLPAFDTRSTRYPPSVASDGHESLDGHTTVFDDMLASDKARIWRRYSWGQDASEDLFLHSGSHTHGNATTTTTNNHNNISSSSNGHIRSNMRNGIIHRSPSFPSSSRDASDVAAFVGSLHGFLDTPISSKHRPARPNSVHFSPD